MTIEEASIGGLGAHVLTLASDEGLVDGGLKIRTMRLPDHFGLGAEYSLYGRKSRDIWRPGL